MATDKNFVIKNGLTVGTSEIITSAGNLTNIGTITTSGNLNVTGDVAINSDDLVVSSSNSRVGINVGTPLATLDIDGDVYIRTGHVLFTDILRPYATTTLTIGQSTNDIAKFTGSIKIGNSTIIDTSRNLTNIGTISSGAITSTGIFTLDTSPASNGVGDLVVIPSLSSSSGVGFAGQVFGVNVKNAVHSTHNAPQVSSTWGGVTGATAIAIQADDNTYGQFQVWTAPQDSSADDLLTPKSYIAGSGNATFAGTVTATGGNSTNWNTAYGWGNHASAGYTDDQTAAEILTAIKTVDGSGSGLDADTLDGVQLNRLSVTKSYGTGNITYGTTDSWYSLIADFSENESPITLYLKSSAHSSCVAVISRGYLHNNVANINILASNYTQNSGYPGVSGIRVFKTTGGVYKIQIRLSFTAASVTSFGLKCKVVGGNGSYDLPSFETSLAVDTTGGSAVGTAYTNQSTNASSFSTVPYVQSNVMWHAGNDGSGSGLDADLLDGQQGSYYLAYGNLTGTPTIPSLSGYATESYVGTQISNLVDSSPAALNTLNELAAALGDDANFSTTVNSNIAAKLPKAGGTMTGSLNVTNSSNITIGTFSTTDTGTLYLTGSTANKQATLKCTNGNLHMDGASGNSMYLNYYTGTSVHFGTGAGGISAVMGPDGDLWKGSTDNSGDRYFNDGYHPNADTLTTARTIGGVSFNGSANINLPGVNTAGNQNTSGTAAGLSGTPNITVGTISSGAITSEASTHYLGGIKISAENASQNYIAFSGTTGDQPGNYNHSYIGEHIYSGGESSELVLAKYNDVEGVSGSDRIRMLGNNILFDTYTAAITPTTGASLITALGTGSPTTKMTLEQDGTLTFANGAKVRSATSYEVLNAGNTDATATSPRFYSPSSGKGALSAGGAARLEFDSGGVTIGATSGRLNLTSATYSFGTSFWAGTSGYPGYQFTGSNSRFGFSSTAGVVDVYADGNFYATDSAYRVWHSNDFSSTNISNWNTAYSNASQALGTSSTPTFSQVKATSTTDVTGVQLRSNLEVMSGESWCTAFYNYNYNDGALFLRRNSAGTALSHFHISGYNNPGYAGHTDGDGMVTLARSTAGKSGGSTYAGTALQNSSDWSRWVKTADRTIFEDGDDKWQFGVDGDNPQITLFYDDHASGPVWDTAIEIGRTNELSHGAGAPNSVASGGYGMSVKGNSDGAFFGMETYSTGNYRPVIAWGDDTTDTPFNVRFNNVVKFSFGYNGDFTAVGNVTAYSDIKLKENIEVIDNAVEKVQQIRGVTFTRNDQKDTDKRHAGVIAQEVEKVLPEVVDYYAETDTKTVAYGSMVGLLIEAVKEQQKQIDELKQEVVSLTSKN